MAIKFDTTVYKRSHGKAPRGRGHWIFKIDGEVSTGEGLYSEVKAAIKRDYPSAKIAVLLP